jgi:hypothetical protein
MRCLCFFFRIPTEIGSWTQVQSIYLSENMLSGSLPTEMGNMASLHTLYVVWLLGGHEPHLVSDNEYVSCFALVLCHRFVANNRLTGTLPSELGNTALSSFNMAINKVSGR